MTRRRLVFAGIELVVLESRMLPPDHQYLVLPEHADSLALALQAMETLEQGGQALLLRRSAPVFDMLRFLGPLVQDRGRQG